MLTQPESYTIEQTLWFKSDTLASDIVQDTIASIGPYFVTTTNGRVIDQRTGLWLNRKYSPSPVYFSEHDALHNQSLTPI